MASATLPVVMLPPKARFSAAILRYGHGAAHRVRPCLRDDDSVLRPLPCAAVAEVRVSRRHGLTVDRVVGLAGIHAAHAHVVVAGGAAAELGVRRHWRAIDPAPRRIVAGHDVAGAVAHVMTPRDTCAAAALVVARINLARDLQRCERRALVVRRHVVHRATDADCAARAARAQETDPPLPARASCATRARARARTARPRRRSACTRAAAAHLTQAFNARRPGCSHPPTAPPAAATTLAPAAPPAPPPDPPPHRCSRTQRAPELPSEWQAKKGV